MKQSGCLALASTNSSVADIGNVLNTDESSTIEENKAIVGRAITVLHGNVGQLTSNSRISSNARFVSYPNMNTSYKRKWSQ
jgi:hypothetical protein